MQDCTEELVLSLLPQRGGNAHKGTFGRLLLVAGCGRYRGAAQLAASGALRIGTGIVTLAATEPVAAACAAALPEATYLPLPADAEGQLDLRALAALLAQAGSVTAVAAGCGLGQSEALRSLVRGLAAQLTQPLLLDADALNLLADDPALLCARPAATVLTPHPGEAARLLASTVAAVQADRIGAACELASRTGCVVVLKGHGTLVAAPDGRLLHNPTGGPGLARGGSGDLLAGMIAGLMAQGLSAFDAAACGVFLHGAAADLCARRRGAVSMLPHELVDDLCGWFAARGL